MNKATELILDDFIKQMPDKIQEADKSLFVSKKIYDDVKHLLKDGCYKGFKLYF